MVVSMAQTKVYDWVEAMAELLAAQLADQMEHQWVVSKAFELAQKKVEGSGVSKVAELDRTLAFE